MKKFLAISVAIIYLAISCGLVLQVHYCMGKETGSVIKLTGDNKHLCGVCGMENAKNKCCHDEIKLIKLQDSHKQATGNFQCQPPAVPERDYNLINPLFHFTADITSAPDHSPPVPLSSSICVLYCTFKI